MPQPPVLAFVVGESHAGHRGAVANEVDHRAVRADDRPVALGRASIFLAEQKRIDAGVGNAQRAGEARIQIRFQLERVGRRKRAVLDARLIAAAPQLMVVSRIIAGQFDDQPAGQFDAMRGDAAHDAIFADALLGRDRIFDRVAHAAVQQAVAAAGRAVGQIVLFEQQHADAAQRQIARYAAAGDAAADDNGVEPIHPARLSVLLPTLDRVPAPRRRSGPGTGAAPPLRPAPRTTASPCE
jgi:hypothetical protein